MEMTLRWYGSKFDTVTLQQIRQIPGVTGVITTLYDTAPGEVWSRERIRAMKDEVAAAGLHIAGIESVNVHDAIKTGSADRDRPSINTPEDIALACYADGKGWKANFEYFMNREYAYNRDKGKCKCCGKPFSITVPKHCHHIDNQLPIERINKVPNLAWLCESCHRMVHNSPMPPELDAKAVRKIMKYREKLKS